MTTLWILEKVSDEKFPYRLTIIQADRTLLALRVQDKWPGQKGNIFCMREDERDWQKPDMEPNIEIERVPVISLNRFGKRLTVVLDRMKNKRCDFLFLTKQYKTREGEYEQIFWRTQKALRERRPRVKLSTYHAGDLVIIVDSNEKYAWRFPECEVEKKSLPSGDYALKGDGGIAAVVERKTYENLLSEFGRMPVFHQQLGELSAYKHSALVIEANYSDFLNPDKVKYYHPAFTAKAIAELYALHPALTIVFAGNRKLANEWTYRFFSAINAHEIDTPHIKVAEVMEQYGIPKENKGGMYFDLIKKLTDEFPPEFSVSMIRENFPDIPANTIAKVLRDMKNEGMITGSGRGKERIWKRSK